jgi:hypothetical protein
MSLNRITAGDYGYELVLTYLDTDTNAAADLSGYTTAQQIHIRAPDRSVRPKSGSFVTDGTDGEVSIIVADGDIPGSWAGRRCAFRIQVTSGTSQLSSDWEEFEPV